MISRQLTLGLCVAALAFVSGCKTTSNRVSYCTQPAVVAAVPAPCAAPCPAPCATPVAPACCPTAGVVPPPPPGFVR